MSEQYAKHVNDRVAILKSLRAEGPKEVGWNPGQVTPPTANTLVATGMARWTGNDGTGVRKIEAV